MVKRYKALYAFQQKMHLCRNAVQNPWPLLKTHIHTAPNQLIEKYSPKHGMILEFISALDDSQWPAHTYTHIPGHNQQRTSENGWTWPCGVACPPSRTLRWGECMKCSGERKRYRHILVYPAEAQRPISSVLVLVEVHPLLVQVPHFLLDHRLWQSPSPA